MNLRVKFVLLAMAASVLVGTAFGIEFNLHRAIEEQRKLISTNPFFALGADIKQLRKLAITQPEAIKNAGVIVAHVDNPSVIEKGSDNLDDLLADAQQVVKSFMEPKKQNVLLNIISPYDRINYDEKQSEILQDSIEKHKQLLRKLKQKEEEEEESEDEDEDEG
ncbi:putative integral membrane protein [Cryptosporidium felis]|nr:putative integral membrane protein [Cryptosporidium felis]